MQIWFDRNKNKIRLYDELSDTDMYVDEVEIKNIGKVLVDKKSSPNCWIELSYSTLTKKKNKVILEIFRGIKNGSTHKGKSK